MSSITATQSPEPFPVLPLLPSEIRLKIYSYLNSPRTVHITYKTAPLKPSQAKKNTKNHSSMTINKPPLSYWASPTPNPITLSLCQESRIEALKIYEAAFGSAETGNGGKIYFDFSRDVLSFCPPKTSTEVNEQSREQDQEISYQLDLFLSGDYFGGSHDGEKRVKQLILPVTNDIWGRRLFVWYEVRLFEALEELSLVVDGQEEVEDVVRVGRKSMSAVKEIYDDWKIPRVRIVGVAGQVWGSLEEVE